MSIPVQETASEIFRKDGGTLAPPKSFGRDPRTRYQLHKDGQIIQLSRRVYRLAELPSLENSDLAAVAKQLGI